jgi:hypothetical protein
MPEIDLLALIHNSQVDPDNSWRHAVHFSFPTPEAAQANGWRAVEEAQEMFWSRRAAVEVRACPERAGWGGRDFVILVNGVEIDFTQTVNINGVNIPMFRWGVLCSVDIMTSSV